MKVHLVHQSFADYVTGLGRGLRLLVPTKISSVIPEGRSTPGTVAADEVLRCRRFLHPFGPVAAFGVARHLSSSDADVMHWQAAGNPLIDLAAVRLAQTRPFVLTVHDRRPHPGDSTVLPGTFAAIQALARHADVVIAHASCVRDQIVDAGIDHHKTHVVAHGELGSVYRWEPQGDATGSRSPTVLFFGRIQPYKGVDVLLDAMELVHQRLPDVRLIVAGAGGGKDRRLGPSQPSWVDRRPGFVAQEDIGPLFADADVVALPYTEASQSGVAALALGTGRPVVASAVGGLVEMVDGGRDGRLVPPGDRFALAGALIDVLTQPAEQRRLSIRAKTASRTRLSWPRIASQTVELYRQALTEAEPRLNRSSRQFFSVGRRKPKVVR